MSDRIVVVGASGFGRETLDTLDAMQAHGSRIEVLGVVDDAPSQLNLDRLHARGTRYLGTIDAWLNTAPNASFVLAIGSPAIRRRLVEKLEAYGLHPLTAVHPTAIIGAESRFEEGVVVSAGAVISTNVRLGRHVHVNPGVIIGHDAILGDFSSLNPGSVVSGEVRILPSALVGAHATILQGLTVSSGATIGAGAVVTKNVPANSVVKGIPAK